MTEATGSLHGPPRGGAFDGWAVDTHFQRTLAPIMADVDRAARIERGRALLGDAATLATLPAAVVRDAQLADAAERGAKAALDAAERQHTQWVRDNRPGDLYREQKRQELTTGPATAVRQAEQLAEAACDRLASVAGELANIRQELADIPQQQRTDDAQHALRRQGRQTREKDLRARLAALGMIA